jgi:hypothetical protein
MGLFDKKKKGEDDYDSPVEQVNLSKAAPQPQRPAAGASQASPLAAAPAAPAPQAQPQQSPLASAPAAPAPAPQPARARAPEPEYDVPNYGIDKAIELMRLLPADNIELVVQVVKKTLESLQIQVPSIIKDASRKQGDIEGRIDVLKKEIAELESEISTRKTEINALETDHKETTTVKERLILAEKLSEERRASTSPGVPGASSSAPTTPAGTPRSSGSYPTVSAPAAAPQASAPQASAPQSAAPSSTSTPPGGAGQIKK